MFIFNLIYKLIIIYKVITILTNKDKQPHSTNINISFIKLFYTTQYTLNTRQQAHVSFSFFHASFT